LACQHDEKIFYRRTEDDNCNCLHPYVYVVDFYWDKID